MKILHRNLNNSQLTASFLATLLMGLTTPAYPEDWRKGAEGREVDCLLQVKGKTYLKGTCMYDADKDGSFRLFGDKYFVYLNTVEDGYAGLSWNETPESSHAQAPLGEDFKRDGGCWIGKKAKVCAWDKKSNQTQVSKTPAEPIKFAKGAYSTIVTGKLSGFESEKNYTIAVGKGQTLRIEQVDENDNLVSVYLTDPNGDDANDMDLSCHSKAVVSPTKAGKYGIKVTECLKADEWKGSYSMKITVK